MKVISQVSKKSYINHNEWLVDLYNEYNKLLEEQSIDYSPMSRKRNIKHIWNNERQNPPCIHRQNPPSIIYIDKIHHIHKQNPSYT